MLAGHGSFGRKLTRVPLSFHDQAPSTGTLVVTLSCSSTALRLVTGSLKLTTSGIPTPTVAPSSM